MSTSPHGFVPFTLDESVLDSYSSGDRKKRKITLVGGCSHEIPNSYMRGSRPSGCGRLGGVFLLCFPESDYSRRTDCVESRRFDSAKRAR